MANILLVEDTADLAEQVADVLAMEGHKVVIANCGKTALQILHERTIVPDVILTDLLMPEVNGFDLMRGLKQDERYRQIPIVIFSADSRSATRDRASSLGAAKFLSKPCSPEILVGGIKEVLARA